MAIDVLGAAVDTLATHLATSIPTVAAVLRSFPDPAVDIAYPSISIQPSGPVARLNHPELIKQVDGVAGHADAYYRIGKLEAPLQLDIWARSATERGDVQDKLISALHAQVSIWTGNYPAYRNNTTLCLAMANYHSLIATYGLDGIQWVDSEDSAARREFRSIFNVTAEADIVIVRDEVKMTLLDIDWRSGTGTLAQLANLSPEVQVIFEP